MAGLILSEWDYRSRSRKSHKNFNKQFSHSIDSTVPWRYNNEKQEVNTVDEEVSHWFGFAQAGNKYLDSLITVTEIKRSFASTYSDLLRRSADFPLIMPAFMIPLFFFFFLPKCLFKQLNGLIFTFIWNKSPSRIRKVTCFAELLSIDFIYVFIY